MFATIFARRTAKKLFCFEKNWLYGYKGYALLPWLKLGKQAPNRFFRIGENFGFFTKT
ncbi:hypothetical protein ADIS_3053 [Lunatimonas lonarensis]|uniref:Uncharacterized protein n=1 Tax=Lunatimonas lonarensis TaxID=1232681 RepID=R7ZRE2_9BACT|nr:hypothetical protein ADIS_3053 [Lunatimonas lonarensis]